MRRWMDLVKKMFDGAPPEQRHDMHEQVRELADDWKQRLNEPAPVPPGSPITEPAPASSVPALPNRRLLQAENLCMDSQEPLTADVERNYRHSVLRERIAEHAFVGDALRRLWQRGVTDVEVLRSEFDAGGYDLVMSYGAIVRHIQFKVMVVGGKRASITASLRLMEKPSGCILWIMVTEDLHFHSYLWFGNPPGQPLPDIRTMKIATHTKANAAGVKLERPNQRDIPRSAFTPLVSLDAVLEQLFGPLP